MLGRRTDLALEAKEIWEEGAAEAAVLEAVSYTHLTLPTTERV